jgi:hypothetical protein
LKVAVRDLRPSHVVIFNDGNRKSITRTRLCHEPTVYIYGQEGTKVAIEVTFSNGERLIGYPSTSVTVESLIGDSKASSDGEVDFPKALAFGRFSP